MVIRDLIAQLEKTISDTKGAMKRIPDIARGLPPDELLDACREMYWGTELIPVESIAELLGCKTQLLYKILGPTKAPCAVCGVFVEVSSRTQLHGPRYCSPCWDKKNAPRREALQEESRMRAVAARKAAEEFRRLKQLHSMPYQEYLASPEWAETRRRALKRCGFRCQLCNREGQLNVHHRTYERRGNEKNEDLIVLCRECHKTFHQEMSIG